VKGNPIELLKIVTQHALNYQKHRYEMAIILDALRTLDTKRFRTSHDVLRSHLGGPFILSKYVTTMKKYDATNATKNDTKRISKIASFHVF
jgi:hypothetical protein